MVEVVICCNDHELITCYAKRTALREEKQNLEDEDEANKKKLEELEDQIREIEEELNELKLKFEVTACGRFKNHVRCIFY